MKPPPVSITVTDLTVRFPVYGVDAKSLKKALARVTVGGVLGRHAGVTDVTALQSVSFHLDAGDRLGLIGHNGSGKTTLLRVLAGTYEPISGGLEVKGSVASMLSITLGMDPDATGMENIFLRGAIMGLSRKATAQIVEEVADFSGIGDYIYMPLRTYSSGMQMRLAFAIATAVPADIILIDEWLNVGDADFAEKAHKRLNEFMGSAKIVVLASHDHALLERHCTRILRLVHGRVVEDRRALQ